MNIKLKTKHQPLKIRSPDDKFWVYVILVEDEKDVEEEKTVPKDEDNLE